MSRAAFSPSSNACRSTAPLSWYSSSAIQVESFVVCSAILLLYSSRSPISAARVMRLVRTVLRAMLVRSTYARHRIRHGIRHTAARAGRRHCPPVANGRLRHRLIGYARVSKTDGSQSLDPLGLATAGPLVGTGLTGRKATRTLESLCFAGSAPGPRCSLSYARLWRACGRASSKHQPTPTPVRTRPRMSSTTRRHTESKVPGRPPSRPSRSVWSANGLARGGHPLSASLTMRLTSPQYG